MNSNNQIKQKLSNKLKNISVLIAVVSILTGCAATGENLQSNVYDAGQVNTAQNAKTIKIISVTSAKIRVDNSQQKKQAQLVGGVLGALAGGLGGGFGGIGTGGTVATTAAGGAIGVGAGSMVSDKVLVDGVTIAYSENDQLLTSAQVGRLCEFIPGNSLVVMTKANETRIQPNSACPMGDDKSK